MSHLATITLEDGESGRFYTLQVEYVLHRERYGDDADGRFGITQTVIEAGEVYAPDGTPESLKDEARQRVEMGER